MPDFKIHPSNLIYLTICLSGILAFFFVGIFPNLSATENLDEDISALNQKTKTQALLYPIYLKLLQEITHKSPTNLTAPREERISHDDLSRINDLFRKLASESDVAFKSAIPDPSNYLDDTGYFSLNLVFSGDFFNLRKIILEICGLPYLASIDTMRIESIDGDKQLSFKIKIKQE